MEPRSRTVGSHENGAQPQACRRLLLLRHGKSEWGDGGLHDHDRPLKAKGENAARLMGRFLSAVGHAPDRVLTSTATRARRTAEVAAEGGGWQCPVEPVAELYDASPDNS